jgi:hypothetical protein
MQAFAILPWLYAVIITHIEEIENIGKMATIIAVKDKYIVLR